MKRATKSILLLAALLLTGVLMFSSSGEAACTWKGGLPTGYYGGMKAIKTMDCGAAMPQSTMGSVAGNCTPGGACDTTDAIPDTCLNFQGNCSDSTYGTVKQYLKYTCQCSATNGACSSTAGACTAGTPSADNGATSCGTTRTWTCNGSGGGSNASCSSANPACGVNGSCGATNNTCNAGTPSGYSAGSCGGNATWTCNGSGGGSNASCTRANAACSVNGSCGATNNTCNAGTPSGYSAGSCGGNATWTCNGSGGGSNASCTRANAACSVNGSCGATNNTCNAGTPSGFSAGSCGGSATWTCNGSGGGSNASCSRANAACPVNGACGYANGNSYASAPHSAGALCNVGAASAVSGSGPWTWTCAGANGGAAASCSSALCNTPVNGACNNAVALGCTTGTAGSDNGQTSCGTTRQWICQGQYGGANSTTCSRSNGACPITGVCNNSVALGCSAGSAASDNGQTACGTTRQWICQGANGGANSGTCSLANPACAPVVNGVCGTSNGVAHENAPTGNFCSQGTASAVSGSGPWTWSCNGSGGGSNASCSAPVGTSTETAVGCGATGLPVSLNCMAGETVFVDCAPNERGYIKNSATTKSCPMNTYSDIQQWGRCQADASCTPAGACGSANGTTVSSAPTTNLCAAGTASAVSGSGPWSWTCAGSTTANCSANKTPSIPCYSSFDVYFGWSCPGPTESIYVTCPAGQGADASAYGSHSSPAVCGTMPSASTWAASECRTCSGGAPLPAGACGSANGTTVSSAPTSNLCSAGSASAVSGSGPWTWTCTGSSTANCSANKTPSMPSCTWTQVGIQSCSFQRPDMQADTDCASFSGFSGAGSSSPGAEGSTCTHGAWAGDGMPYGGCGGGRANVRQFTCSSAPAKTWQYVGTYGGTDQLIATTFDMNCGPVEYTGCLGCTPFPAAVCNPGDACNTTMPCLVNGNYCTMDYGYTAYVWDRYECQ